MSKSILTKLYFIVFYLSVTTLFLRGKALKGSLGSIEISCSSVKNIIFVLFALGIVVFFLSKIEFKKISWKSPLLLSAGLALILSTVFSQNFIESINTLGVVACYVGFFVLVRLTLSSKAEVMRLLGLWSLISAFVCLFNIGYFSYIALHSSVVPIIEDFPFWPGKNMQGIFLVLNAALALGVLLEAKDLKKGLKVWVFFVLCLNLACLTITFSRGAWVAMMAVFIVLIFYRPKIFLPLIGVGVALFILFAPYGLKGRFTSILDFKEANVQERLNIWKSALDMIQDHPLTGVGLGNFYEQYVSKYKMKEMRLEWAGEHAHNLFLHFFAEAGFFGFLAIVLLFLTFFIKACRNYAQEKDPFLKGVIFGAKLACIGFVVYSLVDSTFNGNFSHYSMFHVNLCFMIILALMVFLWPKSQSS